MPRSRASTLWRTQNFLRHPRLADRLAALSSIGPADVVYDLGAGSGVLTAALAGTGARVVAIESDPMLAAQLRARFAGRSNVVIRQADIQVYPLPRADHLVFASPPFDITAAIMRKLTSAPVPPREAYLVLQREAADRYTGTPRQTLAALQIAPWFAIDTLYRFRRTDFVPAPAVDIVLVRVRKRGPPLIPIGDARLYRDLVTAMFAAWRPSVGASLADAIGVRPARRLLAAADIDRTSKPSAIHLSAWLALYEQFARLPEPLRDRVAGADLRLRRQQRRVTKRHRTRVPRDGLAVLHGQDVRDGGVGPHALSVADAPACPRCRSASSARYP